jgi:large subunit ribosomal protein L21
MFAVIKTGGKQYRVQPGDLLVVEKLDGEPGASVAFGEVLMLGEGADVTVGAPLVEGASVAATLIETRKGDKVKIFKKIRRQGYRRTRGHRQPESVLRVTAITGGGQEAKWDGEVKLTTKAELNARSRGLTYVAPGAVAAAAEPKAKPAKAPAKARAAKAVEAAEQVLADPAVQEAMAAAEVNAPVEAEAKPAKKAAAPKKAAEPKADAAPKKAAAPTKAQAAKPAAPKPQKTAAPKAAGKGASAPRKTAPTGRSGGKK